MAKKREPKYSFQDRYRFNWGYQDARADRRDNRVPAWRSVNSPHFDPIYQKGYELGLESASALSDDAWKIFVENERK